MAEAGEGRVHVTLSQPIGEGSGPGGGRKSATCFKFLPLVEFVQPNLAHVISYCLKSQCAKIK